MIMLVKRMMKIVMIMVMMMLMIIMIMMTMKSLFTTHNFQSLTFMSHARFYHFTAALQSVFPQTELGTFMSLTKRDKERQLNELTLIVTGIRLFNRECGKGGEGIDDCKLTSSTHRCYRDVLISFICNV